MSMLAMKRLRITWLWLAAWLKIGGLMLLMVGLLILMVALIVGLPFTSSGRLLPWFALMVWCAFAVWYGIRLWRDS